MGTGFPVFHGGIGFLAVIAPGNSRNGLALKLRALNKRCFLGVPVPAVYKILRYNAGDFTKLKCHSADLGKFIFLCNFLHLFDDIGHNTKFVHNAPFAVRTGTGKAVPVAQLYLLLAGNLLLEDLHRTLCSVGDDLLELILGGNHVGVLRTGSLQVDGVKFTSGGADTAADALVGVNNAAL